MRRKILFFAVTGWLALLAFPLSPRAQDLEDLQEVETEEEKPKEAPKEEEGLKDLEETPVEEAKKPRWKHWEAAPVLGWMAMSSSTNSDSTFGYGALVRYRFKTKGKRADNVETDIEGRHGIEARFVSFSTDYFAEQHLFSGNDALPLILDVGGKSIQLNTARLHPVAEGPYRYSILSVNYIYTNLPKKNLKMPRVTPFVLGGLGYAFGSDSIDFHMYNTDGTINTLADQFFSFEFESEPVIHLGAGVRWQLGHEKKRRWVGTFEVLDYVIEYDDSVFLRGGRLNNKFFFDEDTVYGHNFLAHVTFGCTF
jgi:hypothetical protein